MLGHINIINPEAAIKAFVDMACGNVKFAQIDSSDFEIEQFETKPVKGFVFPERFPLCCQSHTHLFQTASEVFRKFPDCCEPHKRLKKVGWFNKLKYSYLPDKLVKTVAYSYHCIVTHLNAPSWYELITDYFELTIKSYGQFPDGFGSPIGVSHYVAWTKANLEAIEEISEQKRKLLISYLDNYGKETSPSTKTDLNILDSTYQKWLNVFPFELNSYFGELKKQFENQLPFLNGEVETNSYTGFGKAKLHTKQSLFDALINLTNSLLTEINGVILLEKGLITDREKIQVELITQERKQKLKQGYKNSSTDENHRFRKMIKDWLQDERIFWKKLETVLNKSTSDKHVKEVLTFQPIDDDITIPFEIEVIYKNLTGRYQGRFIEFKTKDYHFFTDNYLYYLFLEDWKSGKLFTDYLEPLSQDNVQPYYKAYHQGFLKGYNEFDEKIKGSTSIFQSDKDAIIKRVFEYINVSICGLASYGSGWFNDKHVNTIEKRIWFERGIKAGENYKAWFFVLNNSSYFIDLFRKHEPYISLYRIAAKYWKNEPGGEGMYSHLNKLLQELGENIECREDNEPNDFLLSTIEDHLSTFRNNMSEEDYRLLINAKKQYFETGTFPQMKSEIRIFGKINKKKFGWALNLLFKSQSNKHLSFDYLQFGKDNLSIFKDVPFDETNYTKSRLYNYYTTKTQ